MEEESTYRETLQKVQDVGISFNFLHFALVKVWFGLDTKTTYV